MGFLTVLEFYTMRKITSAERPKKTFCRLFFLFANSSQLLLGKSYTFEVLYEQSGCCLSYLV
jgi:hypothetical protein